MQSILSLFVPINFHLLISDSNTFSYQFENAARTHFSTVFMVTNVLFSLYIFITSFPFNMKYLPSSYV